MKKTYTILNKTNKKEICIRDIALDDAQNRHYYFWQLAEGQEGIITTVDELNIHTYETQEEIRNFIHNKKGLWLVAICDEKIIGEIDLTIYEAQRLKHIAKLSIGILKDFQGQGLGNFLMQEALKWAQEHHLERIELGVFKSNIKAINLYKKFGFIIEGERKNFLKLSENSYEDDLLMAKYLS